MWRFFSKINMKSNLIMYVVTVFILGTCTYEKVAVANEIEFTYVHPYPRGPMTDIKGRVEVEGGAYKNYRVLVYIRVKDTWWIKPYFNKQFTSIDGEGFWSCNINTASTDYLADKFFAFLIPSQFETPPLQWNDPNIPPELENFPYATATKPDLRANPLWIEFTYVPPYGSDADLYGRIGSTDTENPIEPNDYKVLVYIYVSGWWTKPTWGEPLIFIEPDGSWSCDITKAYTDSNATKIIAFLIPDECNTPPPGSGQQFLPSELYMYPYAEVSRETINRTIDFAGYKWSVKQSCNVDEGCKIYPGPNYFTDSPNDVWVDSNGLHLSIVQKDQKWCCSEVIADMSGGYGTYIFTVKGRLDLLNENVIAGLFTWDTSSPQYYHREIDFEFSKWLCRPNNAQFVVQPHYNIGNKCRFNVDLTGHPDELTTHELIWRPSGIYFQSYYGEYPLTDANNIIERWCYTGLDIPPEGPGNPRINFYLAEGNAPTDGQNAEIVIKSFKYLPDIVAKIDIDPDTLNLASNGRWITCYISFDKRCGVWDIYPESILLQNTIQADKILFDNQNHVIMVKFRRSAIQSILEPGSSELIVSGMFTDRTTFKGTDTVKVTKPAKGNLSKGK